MGRVDSVRAVEWVDGRVRLIDQRVLPRLREYLNIDDAADLARAITEMVVRGAPAIGITAAYGVVLAARNAYFEAGDLWRKAVTPDIEALRRSRPTAVNLAWALERMQRAFPTGAGDPAAALLAEALAIHGEDIAANRRMGELGSAFLSRGARVLTHCNTGSLATGGYGTALGVIRTAWAAGLVAEIFAGETRPWLQGARLTAWELSQDGIPATLLVDGAAAYLMQRGGLDWVIVGADRIAANGDVANKIGTYNLAVAARAHGVKMMVVAPTSTVDLATSSGAAIPVETRPAAEVLAAAGEFGDSAAPAVWNPVFDITPARLIDVIVTERGALERPDKGKVSALLSA